MERNHQRSRAGPEGFPALGYFRSKRRRDVRHEGSAWRSALQRRCLERCENTLRDVLTRWWIRPVRTDAYGRSEVRAATENTAVGKDLEGSWEGTLDADGTLLRLTVKLSNQPDGTAAGMLISVDQNGVEIPIAAVVQTNSHLTLHVPSVVGRYEGDFKDGELTGQWTQGPKTWPLVFKRSK